MNIEKIKAKYLGDSFQKDHKIDNFDEIAFDPYVSQNTRKKIQAVHDAFQNYVRLENQELEIARNLKKTCK